MALAAGAARPPHRLLAGLRRRLSTLLLAIMFLLSVFVLAQFLLSREIQRQGRGADPPQFADQRADAASGARAGQHPGRAGLSSPICRPRSNAAESERTRLQQLLAQGRRRRCARPTARIGALSGELDAERQISQRALSQVELLNQQIAALRKQIGALEDALDVSETRDRESNTKIADLGRRLNVALAQRVQELNRYRSDFFGRLREILSDRENIRIVGDRFVFQSEVLFPSGSERDQRRRPGRDEEARRRHHRTAARDSAGDQLGAARRRPHRQHAVVRRPAATATTGSCPRRARPRWSSS